MKKVIDSGRVWKCSNMDTLAPIEKEGIEYLFDDNSREVFWEDDRGVIVVPEQFEPASDEDVKQYMRKFRYGIFKGDKVIVKRGRKFVGEVKEVRAYYVFIPDACNYGSSSGLTVRVGYLYFTDGTKVNINHCDVEGIDYSDMDKDGIHCRVFYEDKNFRSEIGVGGRY